MSSLPSEDTPDLVNLDDALASYVVEAGSGIKLDIGCGQARLPGFIGLDLYPQDKETLRADCFDGIRLLGKPSLEGFGYIEDSEWDDYRFADSSISLTYSSHFLEHIPDYSWDDFWIDLYRISKPGSKHVHIFPYGNSTGAFQDPTHRQFLFPERFLYLSKEWRELVNMDHYLPNVNFKLVTAPWYVWDEDFVSLAEDTKKYHLKHTFNAVSECVVFLEAIKEEEKE